MCHHGNPTIHHAPSMVGGASRQTHTPTNRYTPSLAPTALNLLGRMARPESVSPVPGRAKEMGWCALMRVLCPSVPPPALPESRPEGVAGCLPHLRSLSVSNNSIHGVSGIVWERGEGGFGSYSPAQAGMLRCLQLTQILCGLPSSLIPAYGGPTTISKWTLLPGSPTPFLPSSSASLMVYSHNAVSVFHHCGSLHTYMGY